MSPPKGLSESLVLMLVTQKEGEEHDCAPQWGDNVCSWDGRVSSARVYWGIHV